MTVVCWPVLQQTSAYFYVHFIIWHPSQSVDFFVLSSVFIIPPQNFNKYESLFVWKILRYYYYCRSNRATACNATYGRPIKWNNRLSTSQHYTKQGYLRSFHSNGGCRNCPLPLEIFAETDPHSFDKRRLRQISAYNVSTVKDSERSSIMTNRKTITSFPTSYRCSAYVTPKSP